MMNERSTKEYILCALSYMKFMNKLIYGDEFRIIAMDMGNIY